MTTTRARADRMTETELETLYQAVRVFFRDTDVEPETDAERAAYRQALEVLGQLLADADGCETYIGAEWVFTTKALECRKRFGQPIPTLDPEPFTPERRKHSKAERRFLRLIVL